MSMAVQRKDAPPLRFNRENAGGTTAAHRKQVRNAIKQSTAGRDALQIAGFRTNDPELKTNMKLLGVQLRLSHNDFMAAAVECFFKQHADEFKTALDIARIVRGESNV